MTEEKKADASYKMKLSEEDVHCLKNFMDDHLITALNERRVDSLVLARIAGRLEAAHDLIEQFKRQDLPF